jgi:dihydroflavonol-4-reductase
MKTAFVTGAGGFLGINLVELLLIDNWRVTAFDLKTSALKPFIKKGVTPVKGDVTDRASCERAMPENVDCVFHLAGDTTHWKPADKRQTEINVGGTENMVNAAILRGARRFIYTSSIGAFGAQKDRITEWTKSTAAGSIINYWRTKLSAEEIVRAGIKKGLNAVILNPANIIGPYDYSGWSRLFFLIKNDKLAGAPPGSASFGHVREIARAHIEAFEKGRIGHNYLLGGTDATWLEFIQLIGRLLNKKVPKKPMPSFVLKAIGRLSLWYSYLSKKEPDLTPEKAYLVSTDLLCSSEKAQKELEYKTVSLETMLKDCHAFLIKQGLL